LLLFPSDLQHHQLQNTTSPSLKLIRSEIEASVLRDQPKSFPSVWRTHFRSIRVKSKYLSASSILTFTRWVQRPSTFKRKSLGSTDLSTSSLCKMPFSVSSPMPSSPSNSPTEVHRSCSARNHSTGSRNVSAVCLLPSLSSPRFGYKRVDADSILGLARLKLTSAERSALSKACPYFPSSYLDSLSSMSLNPGEQVRLSFVPKDDDGEMGEIECLIEGVWRECILYEVPIMSISRCFFELGLRFVASHLWTELTTTSERGVLQICGYRLEP